MASGWADERRKRQSELIRTWKPWEKSTGPKSAQGKMKAAKNSYKTGEYCHETHEVRRYLADQNRFLREVQVNI